MMKVLFPTTSKYSYSLMLIQHQQENQFRIIFMIGAQTMLLFYIYSALLKFCFLILVFILYNTQVIYEREHFYKISFT